MKRLVTVVVFCCVGIVIGLGVRLSVLNPFLYAHRPLRPIVKIDTLQSPLSVSGWNDSALVLSNGRQVSLPGFSKLPAQSAALSEATKRGVEISPDGRIYGLVRVHHWCGNDPVRREIARVDLSDMLTFLREGERANPVPDSDMLAREAGGQFSEWGWRVGEFRFFKSYCQYLVANTTVQRTEASRSERNTNRMSPAAGFRR